ncbi:MAG: SH3 domain-containing protein [Gemmatimonadales bacterium]
MRPGFLIVSGTLLLAACAPKKVESAPTPQPVSRPTRPGASPADLERRVARLELSLMEKEAQVEELQTLLDNTRQEVVRAMAKLQTLATRAEAASGIAEAEVSLQTLRPAPGQPATPEGTQATRLLKESSTEFDKANYGGALYLANQAKTLAGAARGRLSAGERGAQRPGETAFALPIRLVAAQRGNVRAGPGTGSRVEFGVEPGDALIGYSYVDEWIRIGDNTGRGGWIFRSLVARP